MSVAEILEELPKLSVEERGVIFQKLSELQADVAEETSGILAAIDEARAEPSTTDVTAEELSRDVIRWARTK